MLFLVAWMICVGLGWIIGNMKERPKFGFTTALILGLLGVIIVAFSKSASELNAKNATYWDKKG